MRRIQVRVSPAASEKPRHCVTGINVESRPGAALVSRWGGTGKPGEYHSGNPRHAVTGIFMIVAAAAALWCAPCPAAPWPFNQDDKPQKADRVIAVWSDTILTRADRPAQRGFGGRLMFYQGKKEEPVKVEGTLAVYAFDETGREPNNSKPDCKYVFTPEQLPAHYSKSKVGHSYSVWLPWDEAGGMQKEITLIVRFETKGGGLVVSQPARQLLPGKVAPRPNPAVATPVNYETPVTPQINPPVQDDSPLRRMSTATFNVPTGMISGQPVTSPPVSPVRTAPQGPWQNPQGWPGQPAGVQSNPQPVWQSSSGLPPRSRFVPTRSRPLGEPLVRLNRDHAPTAPSPAGSPSSPALPPGQAYPNAMPAGGPTAPSGSN